MGRTKIVKGSDYRSVKIYNFQFIDKSYKILADRECLDFLQKWNLDKNLKIISFSFEDELGTFEEEKLIINLFKNAEVLRQMGWTSFLEPETDDEVALTVKIEEVPCDALSLDLFDRIHEAGITLEDGTIRKCFEEFVEEVVVADELRNMLLVEESENYSLFGEEERDEFLFRLFKHLCVGGVLNQYEDNINPYLTMTKTLYKDIVCIRRTGTQKTTRIISKVVKVICEKNGKPILPSSKLGNQDFLYLVINPSLKNLTIILHTW